MQHNNRPNNFAANFSGNGQRNNNGNRRNAFYADIESERQAQDDHDDNDPYERVVALSTTVRINRLSASQTGNSSYSRPKRVNLLHVSQSPFEDSQSWCGDSGSGSHMTPNRSWFLTYERLEKNHTDVVLGDERILPAIGIGVVPVVTSDGRRFALTKILHVPGLRRNLFSIGEVTKKGSGHMASFANGEVYIYGGSKLDVLEMNGTQISKGFFAMNFVTDFDALQNASTYKTTTALSTTVKENPVELWHGRLGHVGYSTVQRMVRKGQIPQIKNLEAVEIPKKCVSCIEGKMHRRSFASSSNRKTRCGELVHFDTVGPFETKSVGGCSYLIVFVDDYSGMIFVYPMKQKSEAVTSTKWMTTIANQQNHQITAFRSDNAREYTGSEMNDYLLDHHAGHELSSAYCPEQNGRVERQNRTIVEMTRTLLHSAKLPKFLWAELARTSSHIRNLIPLDRLGFRSPFEVWTNSTPRVDHLRIIGSRSFVHIPDQQRFKLDKKKCRGRVDWLRFSSACLSSVVTQNKNRSFFAKRRNC